MVIRSARGNQSGAAAGVRQGSKRASANGARSDFMPLIVAYGGTDHRLAWSVGIGLRPAKFHEKLDALGGACFSLPAGRKAGRASIPVVLRPCQASVNVRLL